MSKGGRFTALAASAYCCPSSHLDHWAHSLKGRRILYGKFDELGDDVTRPSSIAGKFMLSVNDVPETARPSRFGVESVATHYTIAGGQWSEVAEIIVTGPSQHEAMPLARDRLSL
jgi:hypothetical protein